MKSVASKNADAENDSAASTAFKCYYNANENGSQVYFLF